MKRDDIIRTAREADIIDFRDDSEDPHVQQMIDMLMHVVDSAVKKEREACAQVAAAFGPGRPIASQNPSPLVVGRWEGEQAASRNIAAAIRARSTQ